MTVTNRFNPAALKIRLMARLYFCSEMNGSSLSLSQASYRARISVAMALSGTRTVSGRPSLVLRGMYSMAPPMRFDFVIFSRSTTRQPIRHWKTKMSRWMANWGWRFRLVA